MKSLFLKTFPPPTFLSRPAVGLDISDRSIKFVELTNKGGNCILKRYGELDIPAGVIDQGSIQKVDELVKILSDWRTKFSPEIKETIVSLPEEVAYVVRLSLPKVPDHQLRQTIELQLDQYVPLSLDNMVFDFEKINIKHKPGLEVIDILVTVFPLDESRKYFEVLSSAGFTPLVFEIEPQALARIAMADRSVDTIMIVEIGRSRTGIEIVSNGVMVLTSTILNIGGDSMTASIKKNLNIDSDEAENLKITHGLLRSKSNLEIFNSLLPITSSLKDELNKVILFWKKKESENGYYNSPVNRVVLCGGQSSLPGLVEYLSGQLKLPVEILNPWQHKCFDYKKDLPQMSYKESLRYATAISLALRGVYNIKS